MATKRCPAARFISYEILATLYSTSEKRETEYFIDSAELGFKDIDGTTPGSITSLRIDRLDDRSRLSPPRGVMLRRI